MNKRRCSRRLGRLGGAYDRYPWDLSCRRQDDCSKFDAVVDWGSKGEEKEEMYSCIDLEFALLEWLLIEYR